MRKLLATLSLALLPSVAMAGEPTIYCTLSDVKGADLEYFFTPSSQNTLAEMKVSKGGSMLVHARDKRPVWSTKEVDGVYIVTYVADPRFVLAMKNDAKPVGKTSDGATIMASKALLFNGKKTIAKGACAYRDEPDDDPAPRGKRRELAF